MNPLMALLAALVGYLLGSISFARIVFRLVAPGQELKGIELDVPIVALAMIPDIRSMIDRKRRGVSGSFAGAMDVTPMGRGIKKMAGWFGWMQEKIEPEGK